MTISDKDLKTILQRAWGINDVEIENIETWKQEVAKAPHQTPKRERWMQQIRPLRRGRKRRQKDVK